MKRLLSLSALFIPFYIFAAGGDSDFEQQPDATHFPAIIQVVGEDVDETIARLEDKGVTVLYHRGDILLTFIPTGTDLDDLESDGSDDSDGEASGSDASKRRVGGSVRKIEIGQPRRNTPAMNLARGFYNADYIGQGYLLPQPFTGEGVVVGICDVGFDARHPNFLNREQTECRVRKVVQYEDNLGLRTEYNTPEEIYKWRTDDPDDWHATHVAGIAAGAHMESNYYSLAPDADIVFTGSQLSDVGLLAGVEDIIAYAKEVGKPAVVNLSMGNYVGPHDGSSLFTQYLDRCADDAIICLSAGNEGKASARVSMRFDFTEQKPQVCTWLSNWSGLDIYGEADVWSRDDTPFEFAFFIYPGIKLFPYLISEDGSEGRWRISADPADPDFNEDLAKYFYAGDVEIRYGVSRANGRYFTTMDFDLHTDIHDGANNWSKYSPAIDVKGSPGSHVDIHGGGPDIFLRQVSGFPVADNTLNISDLATGHRTVSVGMMCNTDMESGDPISPGMGYLQGEVSDYSGFGTLVDGRVMPLTVAPGGYVISSMSLPFLEAHPDYLPYTDYETDFDGGKAYWIATSGTSMSCPFVVGAIATWLQAYPGLTSDQAVDIIRSTNVTTGIPFPENPRHGQGWFNAYGGIQKVLDIAANKVGTVDRLEPTISFSDGRLLVGNPTGGDILIEIYTPAGMLADRATLRGTLPVYPLSHLSPGIYIVKSPSSSLKIAVR